MVEFKNHHFETMTLEIYSNKEHALLYEHWYTVQHSCTNCALTQGWTIFFLLENTGTQNLNKEKGHTSYSMIGFSQMHKLNKIKRNIRKIQIEGYSTKYMVYNYEC